MIAEPYICIKGPNAGQIRWENWEDETEPSGWQPYADFEREKLRELGAHRIYICHGLSAYVVDTRPLASCSDEVIGYTTNQYEYDPECVRLLHRAKFLKAVCEEQGVEWLPSSCDAPKGSVCLTCAAHRAEEERVDDLLKEAARKHGVPRSYFGEPPSHDVFPVYNQVEPHTLEDDLGTSHDVVKELCKKGTLYVGQDEEHLKEVGPIRNIHIEVCPKMPDDEAVFYDKETGDAVRLKNIGRDYYTKEEVDERVRGVVDLLSVPGTPGDLAGWYDDLKSYRSRFLS